MDLIPIRETEMPSPVTEEGRRTTAAIAAQHPDQLARFFSLSLDLLCIAGVDGYFKRVNPAFEHTLGFSTAQLLATPFVDFVHPDDRAATLAVMETLTVGVPTINFENRYRCADGSYKWLAWTTYPVVAEGLLYAVGRNRTEAKQIEAALRRHGLELENANAELESFSSSASHDLRAPLRAIAGFSAALEEDCGHELSATGSGYLRRVRKATARMEQLVEDLLKLAQLARHELRCEPVDLGDLARRVTAVLDESHPSRHVTKLIAPDLHAYGDPGLLRTVLENLLGNAWKFTASRADARVEFGVRRENGQTVYFVRDNGVGFDTAQGHRLFVAFQRLHSANDFEGSGVGLATVRRIVRRHGGQISAEGGIDEGATFSFTLGPPSED